MGVRERESVAEHHAVVGWRRDQLLAAGFPLPLASSLAEDSYDIHALIELAERGCPPALAVRILAPLDGRNGAA